MRRLLYFLSIFILFLLTQGVEKAWGQDEKEQKIENDWINQTNQKLLPIIRSHFESFLSDMKSEMSVKTDGLPDNDNFKADLQKFHDKYIAVDTNIPLTEIDSKSALDLQVTGAEKGDEGKSIALSSLCTVKVNDANFLFAFYSGGGGL